MQALRHGTHVRFGYVAGHDAAQSKKMKMMVLSMLMFKMHAVDGQWATQVRSPIEKTKGLRTTIYLGTSPGNRSQSILPTHLSQKDRERNTLRAQRLDLANRQGAHDPAYPPSRQARCTLSEREPGCRGPVTVLASAIHRTEVVSDTRAVCTTGWRLAAQGPTPHGGGTPAMRGLVAGCCHLRL